MANKKNSTEISGVRKKTHESVDKIMDKAESMKEKSKEFIDGLKEKAMINKENVENYVQENPKKSLLIAAGIGIVVGAILVAVRMRKEN